MKKSGTNNQKVSILYQNRNPQDGSKRNKDEKR